ncbi:phage tail tape measure protein [Yersinia enterocolitica]|nr:phage tail tape measure protein [Yersinia enterocolitica]
MADIATIALRADTSSLEQGDKALDHFGQTAEKATKQADGLNESNTKLASSYDEAAKSLANNYKATTDYNESVERSAKSSKTATAIIEEQKAGLSALLDRINPTNRAFSELDEISKKLRAAKNSNLINSEEFEHYNSILSTTADRISKVADALTEEGRAATAQAAADRKATEAKEAFLAKLRDQNALFKASASDSATYRAAQLGITAEAAPMITAIKQQEEATRRDAEQKKLAAIAARGLKESIKQLEAEERAAIQATKAQEAADKAATDAKENFLRKIKEQVITQNMSKQELLQYKATQLGVSSSADVYIKKINESSDAVHSFSLKSAGARRELGVMLGELARGNLGALRGSSITLANRSGLIDQLFSLKGAAIAGGIGLATAALVGLTKAYFEGAAESQEFNKQIILTGNYSGRTAGQLSDVAKNISKTVGTQAEASRALAAIVSTGAFSGDQLQGIATTAVAMQKTTGQSVDKTIADFKRLRDDPVKASAELNEQYHYLTASVYQQISALEQEGDTVGAAKLAMDSYSNAMKTRTGQVVENLGAIESAWNSITGAAKDAWDQMLNVGRTVSATDTLSSLKAQLAQAKASLPTDTAPTSGSYGYGRTSENIIDTGAAQRRQQQIDSISSLERQIALAEKAITLDNDLNESRSTGVKINDEGIKAQQGINSLIKQGLTPAEKRIKSEKELNLWIEANRKAHLADSKVALFTQNEIEKARLGIDNQYKDKKEAKPTAYHDDAATKALLDSEARIAALREQSKVTETMTDQEKQLAKFTQQIADLKSKTILTADQKSLLARSGEITASMQLEAQLSRENAERKKATAALKQMDDYTTTIANRNAQAQAKFGKTSKQASRVDQEFQLDNTFDKQKEGVTGAELEKLTESYNKAKFELKAGFDQEDLNEGKWLAGMTQGLEQYGETANNVFSATAQLAQTTMGSMTSMATQMMTTGSANVKQFATNFLTSIVDIINRLLIAQAIQAAMGWMSGGASAGAGAVSGTASSASTGAMGMSTSFRAYDVGGYTGDGGKFEPKGVVHGGEFVFTKEATNRIGIDNLYKMMRGYADGGLVSNAVTATAPMLGMQGGGNNITVGIGDVVIMSDSQKENNASNSQDIGAGIQKQLKPAIVATISEQLRIPGTPLWMAMNGNR